MFNRTRCAAIVLIVLGVCSVIAGVLLIVYGDSLISSSVNKGCELREGTDAYNAWREPPVPSKISFYLFNITNTNFLYGQDKPILKEVGPFVYQETRRKKDVKEYVNGTISYHETRNYTFLPDESLAETTVITTVNIVYMVLVNILQREHVPEIGRTIVMGVLSNEESPIMRRTAKEILWGYEDPLLKRVQEWLPGLVQDDTVSIFYSSVSGAELDTYLINSGVNVLRNQTDRVKQVGNIERFNGNDVLPNWLNKYANMINGTDDTIWHPDVQRSDSVYIFSPDICRSMRLTYDSEYVNPFGITNYRFKLPQDTFNNTVRKDFCLNTTAGDPPQQDPCLADGLMSLTTCVKQSGDDIPLPLPIVASSPYFWDANYSTRTAVDFLEITGDELHNSFMDIEPITGTVMNGSSRMQINVNVFKDPAIEPIMYVQPVVMPMMWLDEHTEIDQANADKFRHLVYTPITTLNVIKYFLISLGCVVFIIATALIIRIRYRQNREGEVFPETDETSPLFS